jgi:hypothetical protein
LSTGLARPTEAAISLFGSLVEERAKTVKTICPTLRCFLPSCLEQWDGFILDTETKFRSAISASRKDEDYNGYLTNI